MTGDDDLRVSVRRLTGLGKTHVFGLVAALLFAAFAFIPIGGFLASGPSFGWDVGEYLLTSRSYLTGSPNVFAYPYPLLPALYVPLVLATPGNPLLAYRVADIASGLLILGVFLTGYAWMRRVTGSRIGSALGAALLGTFPLLLDGVGWGGQAQMLAMVLGLSALALVARRPTGGGFRSHYFGAGAALALAVLAEPYAAAYFGVTAAVWFLWELRARLLAPPILLSLVPIFLPALIAGLALLAYDARLLAYGAGSPLLLSLGTPGLGPLFLSRLTFGHRELLVVYAGVVILYLMAQEDLRALRLWEPGWVLSASTAFVIEMLLLTTVVYGDRGLYYVGFPLALLVALSGAAFPRFVGTRTSSAGNADARPSVRPSPDPADAGGRRFRLPVRRSDLAHSYFLISSSIVLLVAVQVVVASETYPPALGYYDVPNSTLPGLDWLRHENGSVLLVPPPNWFPVAFTTQRTVYAATQPEWFIASAQVNDVIEANALASGVAWINAGPIKVVDAEPVSSGPSPGVFLFRYPYIVEPVWLSDAQMQVTFSPWADPANLSSVTPGMASPISVSYGQATLEDQYALPHVTLTKTISIGADSSVDIELVYRFSASIPRTIALDFVPGIPTSVSDACPCTVGEVKEVLASSYRNVWELSTYQTTLSVQSNSGTAAASPVPSGMQGESEVAVHPVPSGTPNSTVSIHIRIAVAGIRVLRATTVTEQQTLTSTGIRWAIVDHGAGPDVIARFEHDPLWRAIAVGPNSQSLIFGAA